jgi:hypothetical protein
VLSIHAAQMTYAPLDSPSLLLSQRRNSAPLLYSSPAPFAQDPPILRLARPESAFTKKFLDPSRRANR